MPLVFDLDKNPRDPAQISPQNHDTLAFHALHLSWVRIGIDFLLLFKVMELDEGPWVPSYDSSKHPCLQGYTWDISLCFSYAKLAVGILCPWSIGYACVCQCPLSGQ